MKNTEVNAINEAETRFQPETTKHGTNFAPQRGLDFFCLPSILASGERAILHQAQSMFREGLALSSLPTFPGVQG